MELNPQIIENATGKLVVLPLEEYNYLTELLEDYQDSMLLKATMENPDNKEGNVPIEEVMKQYGIEL